MDKVLYEGEGYFVELVVRVNERGEILFMQNHVRVSVRERMSQDEIERTRAVMKAVETKLVNQCGMKELMSGIEEEILR